MNDVVTHLKDIAQFYSDAGDGWRAQAFVKAAVAIEKHPKLQFKDGKLQDKISGVGNSIKTVIEEFTATGSSSKFKELVSTAKPTRGGVHYMQEITENWNTDYRVPNHIYLLHNTKCVGYVREGTNEVQLFKSPMFFNKRGRKFKELSATAVKKAGFVEVKL